MNFQIYKDKADEWRWRLVAANNKIIGDSGEGYTQKSHCEEMVTSIKANATKANVTEVETTATVAQS